MPLTLPLIPGAGIAGAVGVGGRAGQGTVGAGSAMGKAGVDGHAPVGTGSDGTGVGVAGTAGVGNVGAGGVGRLGTGGVGTLGAPGRLGTPDAEPLVPLSEPSTVTSMLAEPFTPRWVDFDFGGTVVLGAVAGGVLDVGFGAVEVGAALVAVLPEVTVVVFTV